MLPRRRAYRAYLLPIASLPGLLVMACAVRVGDAEHYVGPVLFRYSGACRTDPAISQVVQAGVVGEAGRQWGMTLGVWERIAATAADGLRAAEPAEPCEDGVRWTAPLSIPFTLAPRRWTFSPIYLRCDGCGAPAFVARTAAGVQAVAGPEASALSVGVTTRTLATPPDDAFWVLRFDARRPMETRFTVWPMSPGADRVAERVLDAVRKEEAR
jgi:hypothetical protein